MKNVLKSHSQVAHYWANNIQESGRSTNMSFDTHKRNEKVKTIIYSYNSGIGANFKENPQTYFLYDRSYSNSTSKHQNHVIRALSSNKVIFKIGNFISYYDTFESLIDQSIEYTKEVLSNNYTSHLFARSRSYFNFDDCNNFENRLRWICQHEKADLFKKWVYATFDIDLLINKDKQLLEYKEKQLEREKEKQINQVERFFDHKVSSVNGQLAYLRLSKDGQKIETSKGIKLPLEVSQRYFKQWENGLLSSGQMILGYSINEVCKNHIIIGCHTIVKTEQLVNLLNN
jgi:hypothetical protein